MPMSMDQLFKALPRDLQWEILSEYVGSHSVRKGKLMTKMVFDDRHKMVKFIRVCRVAFGAKRKAYDEDGIR